MLGRTRTIAAGVAAAAVIGGLLYGGAGGTAALCDDARTQEKLFAVLRADYPNKASQEVFGHGSTLALDRILKTHGLSREKPDDIRKAAEIGVAEAKLAYQTAHYMLERVAVVQNGNGEAPSCSGQVVFLTAWGIVVKLVTWDVTTKDDSVDVKLTGMR
jgi:hypothetical protein